MNKSFLILTGFFAGMLFVAEPSSGYFSLPLQPPSLQVAQRSTHLEIPKDTGLTVKLSKKDKPRAHQQTKLSENYADQLSALRYVMRSA